MRIRVGGGVVHCTLVRNACWLVAGGLLVAFGLAYLGEGDGPSVALGLVLAGAGILLALWMSLLQWVVVSPRGVFSPRKGGIPGATLQGMAWYEVGSNVLEVRSALALKLAAENGPRCVVLSELVGGDWSDIRVVRALADDLQTTFGLAMGVVPRSQHPRAFVL